MTCFPVSLLCNVCTYLFSSFKPQHIHAYALQQYYLELGSKTHQQFKPTSVVAVKCSLFNIFPCISISSLAVGLPLSPRTIRCVHYPFWSECEKKRYLFEDIFTFWSTETKLGWECSPPNPKFNILIWLFFHLQYAKGDCEN